MIDQSSASSHSLLLLVVAQLLTFLGVIANLWFNYLREGRARKWALEDRETAGEHHETVETHLTELGKEVTATKDAAGAAYTEANHVNNKLEALGLAHNIRERTKAEELAEGVKMELDRLAQLLEKRDVKP